VNSVKWTLDMDEFRRLSRSHIKPFVDRVDMTELVFGSAYFYDDGYNDCYKVFLKDELLT